MGFFSDILSATVQAKFDINQDWLTITITESTYNCDG